MRKHSLESVKSAFALKDVKDNWQDPPLDDVDWEELDFLAWNPIGGSDYFVCFENANELVGAVFSMNAGGARSSGHCDLCYATNREHGVKAAMIEVDANPRYKIGLHVCSDLACSARVRGNLPAYFMYETISVARRIERLQQRASNFARRLSASR